jgi:hypothetical protein
MNPILPQAEDHAPQSNNPRWESVKTGITLSFF